MNSVGTGAATDTGFSLSGRDARVIGGATGLLLVTIAVMYVLATTPLAGLNRRLFPFPILGVLVYGVAIGGGEYVAERAVERRNLDIAGLGTAILILAFGTFGAG